MSSEFAMVYTLLSLWGALILFLVVALAKLVALVQANFSDFATVFSMLNHAVQHSTHQTTVTNEFLKNQSQPLN